ncbi:MAG: histidine--tRNA ligase [Actinomycetota bacterium]
MARPTSLSGFPESLPAGRVVEQQIVDDLRQTFELHGFAGIETRAVEPLSQLLQKGEIDKEVYLLRRLQADADAADSHADPRTLALHFDLTVPFARYVIENSGQLEFPFRRYQIQKVWRGERPQEGRYREFLQADIDVIDRDALPFHYEVELIEVMADAFSLLPLPPMTMRINNRRLMQGFGEGLGLNSAAMTTVLGALDKLDKIGPTAVAELLRERAQLTSPQVDACLALAAIRGHDAGVIEEVGALGVTSELLDQGLAEVALVLDHATAINRPGFTVLADFQVARGLDYYTGTVYETVMSGYEHLGSVCSGGRYDSLASDGRTTYPGVGLSFGVTRALAPLLARGVLASSRSVPTCVLIALPTEVDRPSCGRIAQALRQRGIACEVAPAAVKFGRQIRYAERRGIPFVWFPAAATADGVPAVRDIQAGVQEVADPATWLPPDNERRPRIVTKPE